MSVQQKRALADRELADEVVLDSFDPEDFLSFPHFGPKYISYVRELRELDSIEPVADLIRNPDATDTFMPPYKRKGPLFQPLDSGRYDVRITMQFSAPQARWLESLIHRLPSMYPDDPDKCDLGFHIAGSILELMRLDTERHGKMNEGGIGTMNEVDIQKMKGL